MTILSSLPRQPARACALACGLLAIVFASTLLVVAGPAHAEVAEVGGTSVGLQAANQSSFVDSLVEARWNAEKEKVELFGNPGPETFRNPAGRPVLHGASTFAIYWDPAARYNPDWQHLVNGFLQAVGASSGTLASVFAVDAQYTDSSNKPAYYQSTFRGAYTDTHQYPAKVCKSPQKTALTCLTNAQMQAELKSLIAARGLPKGMSTIYYLLTPPDVTVCVDAAASRCSEFERSKKEEEENTYESASYKGAICSYHSAINPSEAPTGDANTILYGVVPWTAGSAGQGQNATVRGQAAYCQDGGWNPASNPSMEREQVKPRNALEQEEFLKKSPREQELLEQSKSLQGPHVQEPNQLPCPNLEDGRCDAGLGDLIVNQIAVEQQNITTNPMLNAWQDSTRKEATDECRNFFASGSMGGSALASVDSGAGTLSNQALNGHSYYLNMAFNLAASLLPYPGVPCVPAVNHLPQFTSPNPVNSGEVVAFDGMESNITLDAAFNFVGGSMALTYAKYAWNFGDGTPPVEGFAPGAPACEEPWLTPCAASALHSYQYGGTYQVTLTATDVAGNVQSVVHSVTVSGPAPPASSAAAGSGGAAGGAAAVGPGAGSPAAGAVVVKPKPVVAVAAGSRSLRSVRRNGLPVRYSVSEQVVGHFEVLLASSIAHRLGLHGAAATGLAAGTPAQIVIGKAVLVTTKGGRSTVNIQFGKKTAERLARLRHVPLLLRLVVRNAANQTGSALGAVTLSH